MATEKPTMKVTYVKDYGRIHEVTRNDPRFGAAVEAMFAKAVGYGWGRIDAPGVKWPEHGGDALDFATAYAIHYTTPGTIHALREAYESWYAKGEI